MLPLKGKSIRDRPSWATVDTGREGVAVSPIVFAMDLLLAVFTNTEIRSKLQVQALTGF